MEWIEYDKFKDVEYLAKGGFGTVFKAIWKDGFINKWDYENDQWEREAETKVALKSLHNSQDITTQFLKEIEAHNSSCSSVGWIVRCFGITKDPETENFMMIMELKEGSLRQHLNNNFISMDWVQKFCNLYGIVSGLKGIHNNPLKRPDVNKLYELLWNLFNYAYNTFDPAIDKQIKEVEKINKESTYLSTSSPLLSNGTFSYMTHPQAIYTSKLLDFKNLPEPKNTNNNEDLLGSEYSESMSFDFSKLDINSKDENN
ncbi:kinase-like domain-containing protein [Rhizophagus irregularis DAOM 181602=DAOM 197198]|nr:kinase-like domain-containing protein [Rhizophagus irregularis DAOM 181602=DAOM 197198]